MIHKLKSLFSHKLVSGSLIFLSASMVANVGSYLYHLVVGRWLGPANYSIFESLVSILYYLSIPGGVFSLLIVKLAAEKKDNPLQISVLLKTLLVQIARLGFIVLGLYLVAAVVLQQQLKIPSYWLLVGIGLTYYFGSISSPILSVLQGLTKFKTLGWLTISGSWLKLLVLFPLLLIGFQLNGVIVSMVIGSIILVALVISTTQHEFKYLYSPVYRKLRSAIKKNSRFLVASFLLSLTVTALYTTDVLLARKFLSPIEAGYYSALSVMGKIIFFASSAVNSVVYPYVVEKHKNGGDSRKTLFIGLGMILFISAASVGIYALFPDLMIKMLYGSGFMPAAPYLVPFALFISLYAVNIMLLNYYMGISALKTIYIACIFILVQFGGLWLKHQSISDMIFVNLGVMVAMLIFLFARLLLMPNKPPRVKTLGPVLHRTGLFHPESACGGYNSSVSIRPDEHRDGFQRS